ncbi:Glu/Leu/Phe/Val family dehydrogenase [Afifella marina]|uniref:Leucine dehydrogenase n=1 Tax=Afifella marina DSM 2698 TaxID=1120955 RepID=A0A1G5NP49_AFIMA|nr:Glu/Leu/Phe/Val dehydrogenase dimerization domain-containing protein [Afifella marina]MBK1624536.1 Glu/Leu/Phe/Val dehydrogenase [Afifella marina DSM 2698]MBK1627429.1 Glu/Leu/Phe/Val dehydrogenase [Afifella marina]MBK5918487.1 amino acid dehydrogenase [Afifella marina]RAI20642.1 amino acid dehydrogenase [Afifella marina DSM 2698]SCZ39172.1 leucine dehydrogenase [Afifella marina DSM 2698]
MPVTALSEAELARHPAFDGHEEVVRIEDEATGLAGYIAIHDTTLGPSLGGCRVWRYADEHAALEDVLRLSRGMTYKTALAGLNLGGGKAVIILAPGVPKTPALFEAFGAAIENLSGRYITAEDVGTAPADMADVARATKHVRGTPASGVADPSPHTALGVFHGILAAVEYRFASSSLEGIRVAIQGLGHVGWRLAEKLHEAGADLLVSDIDEKALARAEEAWGALAVPPAEIHAAPVDLFAPCALGAGLNRTTIPQIRAAIVAGAANNQLAEADDAGRLLQRGILYAPDYAINAGGVVALALAGAGHSQTETRDKVEAIGATLASIFARAAEERTTTAAIADRLAEERLTAVKRRSQAA